MKKSLIFIIFSVLFFGLINLSQAEENISESRDSLNIAPTPLIEENNKYSNGETITEGKEIMLGDNNLWYNIGFNNSISETSIFSKIQIKSETTINGKILYYKREYIPAKQRSETYEEVIDTLSNRKPEFEISINGHDIVTYYSFDDFYNHNGVMIIKDEKGNIAELDVSKNFYNKLIYTDKYFYNNDNYNYLYIKNLPEELFLYEGINNIEIYKDLTEKDIEIIKDLALIGKNILIEESKIKEYFGIDPIQDNQVYLENYDFYYYSYGIGAIFPIIEFVDRNINNSNFNTFLNKDYLIDEVIISKFPAYYILLIIFSLYVIILFLVIFIYNKNKQNRLGLMYLIPIISVFFLFFLVILNYYYKGTKDIENKIQVNHIFEGIGTFSEIKGLLFSVYGDEYSSSIDPENFSLYSENYYYNQPKKTYSYEDGKININFTNLRPSEIITYSFQNIGESYEEKSRDYYDQVFDTKQELLDFLKNQVLDESDDLYSRKDVMIGPYYEEKYNNIKFIGIKKGTTDFMNKYSLTEELNYTLIIDVYYD